MDTITHGIAGALIGKAIFGGRDLFPARAMGKDRVITWAVMLGAIFPDSDVFREFVSKNDLLMLTWHRSITHSLLCLPLWSALLAWITVAICRWRKWQAPPFATLCGLYAVGILSHIFLDLVTTFGTMIWSPLEWSRPAWDILFIVDFTFAAILLIPQLLAWAYDVPESYRKRAFFMWLVFTPAPFLISRIARIVGALLRILTGVAITLLQLPDQLLALAGDDLKIVVGQFAELLMNVAFHLLPLSLDFIPIHEYTLLIGFTRDTRRAPRFQCRRPAMLRSD